MFSWQRTAYHFQPEKNWMNDPDGPLFHKGWYHLFYQYNPDSAVWGNITWGHAVSTDLIHWLYLPFAMIPDRWYDMNGVWTGSATLLPDGRIMMLYTGSTNESIQVQNLAYPANLSDPLLIDWVKYPDNPVIVPPNGTETDEFRDPTTAWMGPDGTWRITIGSRYNKSVGLSLVYQTSNFTTYDLLEGVLHAVPGTGMWECVDFYPVAINGSTGLDSSAMDRVPNTYLRLVWMTQKGTTTPSGFMTLQLINGHRIIQKRMWALGLQVDYGRYYASKTFYDQSKQRRVLWGWINETDTETDNLAKGWASVQTIPREVLFDNKTGANILQWPVEEIESLRLRSTDFTEIVVGPGSVVPLSIGQATQLDIFAEFEIEMVSETKHEKYGCRGGAVDRSNLGPFGLLVIADQTLSELTPIFFRPVNTTEGTVETYFCADETRSSEASDVYKQVYGSTVPVLTDEKFQMRLLVDHSIVESFAQGGRRVITSRVYPTKAIYGDARLFLFNNATGVKVKATLKIWDLNSAFIHPFPFDQN
ncbi:ACID BETA-FRUCTOFURANOSIDASE 4 VACUOLAR [Salix koriyanagi]|uniref:ACID BETA-FRUCTOFURANOSIDASE 4 VACUOLAR n=1 Tax=Salix koriyanagi TaxID=2511006 RepID=A0A9Q0ST09_9ROSI|nr:ACID BETA-FRUCTOFURANOSIDASE 4 VACUOLAR [Salix koriyanagi]